MTQPIHTSGPAKLPTGFESVKPDEHDGMPLFSNGDPFDTIAIVLPRTECNANARLLAAAYNAFDSAAKKLGVNAVELAESMQDCGLFALIDAAQFAAETFEHSGCAKNVCPICDIRAILAKVKGGAA